MYSLKIDSIGKPTITSPITLMDKAQFTSDSERILHKPTLDSSSELESFVSHFDFYRDSFEVAGPRHKIFFAPNEIRVAIVTCGGLCPGLNSVVRALVHQLWLRYGCHKIFGVMNGYQGLSKDQVGNLMHLSPEIVEEIHQRGGTILGTSRGTPPTSEIVDSLISSKVDLFFVIGGDGTMRGAVAIAEEVKRRNVDMSIIGIPKTIDNDIPFVRRSFGFETAVGLATDAVRAGYIEASSVVRGIGLVKLMGRDSGYIAANATLASGVVDFCLIPEIDFDLDGSKGLMALMAQKLEEKNHLMIVVAEGAGQKFFAKKGSKKRSEAKSDASGNSKLGNIGVYLKEEIENYFNDLKKPITLKYIDPSYLIRAGSANPGDQLFCTRLAQNAVHAGMAGKTSMLVGYWHGRMTHVPFAALGENRQRINPQGELWFNVLESTGQPAKLGLQ